MTDVKERTSSKSTMKSVKDKPGEFSMIDKKDLRVDSSYQRRLREDRAKKYAEEWSWVACGALSISLRDDGEWFVVDGGHRLAAAMLRPDIKKLPCLIFEMEEVATEAGAFLDINNNRRAMSMVDRFNALRIKGDPAAKVVDELVTSIGRRVIAGSSPTTVACAASMLNAARADEAALRRIWPVINRLCANQAIQYKIIEGMFYLETHVGEGYSISQKRWTDKLLLVGYVGVCAEIDKTAAFYGSSSRSRKNSAIAIANLLNRGNKRIKFPFTVKEE